jgi:exodeoxyribonuclease VII large subunit
MNDRVKYNFDGGNERFIYTVSQISSEIKLILENSYPTVWIQGEISNFRLFSSGHMYFSIKDAGAQIKAAMFKSANISLSFAPKDGMSVLVYGKVSSYIKHGDCQVIVNHMEQYGKGELYESYEKLKDKLEKEGLFRENSKKPVPNIVNRIGLVTSQDGAALFDILKVIDNLNAEIEVLIYPVRVQGKEAETEISEAIEYLNCHYKNLDVLLVGRGGGSIEDLWAFNTERVARAVFASRIPVVSCVGHEIDFTITDFVADLRAPTPSVAAEMVLRNRNDIKKRIEFLKKSLIAAVNFTLDYFSRKLYKLMSSNVMSKPYLMYGDKMCYLEGLNERLSKSACRILEAKFAKLEVVSRKLDMVYPLFVLRRGFSVCYDSAGKVVKDSKSVKIGSNIRIQLALGGLKAEVKGYG